MPKKLEPIPTFASEEEDRRFWETHDSFDYVDWDDAVRVHFTNLKLSKEPGAEQGTPASDKAAN